MTTPARHVAAELEVYVSAATELEMQVTVAKSPGLTMTEQLSLTLDGEPVEAEEMVGECGSRIHRLWIEPGLFVIDYSADIHTPADPVPVGVTDRSMYLRPSRYAECDKFFGFAAGQFDTSLPPGRLLDDVTAFVEDRLSYIPGASDPIDGATDTLLAGAGVCRDYAHLVVALLRGLGIPARLAAVYAPGCDPMDFHAVAEAIIDDEWVVVDATRLAPRQTLVRIATGRDAADTAFLDNHGGSINLNYYKVTATVDGELPTDTGTERVRIR
ncbi:transglutaminase family protein [Gordonia sp. CPCC 206044]|uniref:transglutaminase-like domain-containing protein n=1 Tax=Gordonia sp. CPCC 206044 TaxID=3140793 RepID=UPI003AF36D6F